MGGARTKDDEHLTSGLPKLDNSVEVCIVSEPIVAGGNFEAARRGLLRTKADLERLEPYQTSFSEAEWFGLWVGHSDYTDTQLCHLRAL